ncbi:hypothetical protein [Streptomyces sp. NPDC006195]|uniref:hypothetical protein n=1 Tax=unclassified Streptomyces TaxID=2593676 RepID=UPI0033A09F44
MRKNLAVTTLVCLTALVTGAIADAAATPLENPNVAMISVAAASPWNDQKDDCIMI